jgi:hypothetical protein
MQQCPFSRANGCSANEEDLTPTSLRLSLQSGPFPSDFSTSILDEFLMSAMRSVYHILFVLICLPIEIIGPYTGFTLLNIVRSASYNPVLVLVPICVRFNIVYFSESQTVIERGCLVLRSSLMSRTAKLHSTGIVTEFLTLIKGAWLIQLIEHQHRFALTLSVQQSSKYAEYCRGNEGNFNQLIKALSARLEKQVCGEVVFGRAVHVISSEPTYVGNEHID